MRTARGLCSLAIAVLLASALPSIARADDADAKAAARELAEQAQDKTEAGDHEGALALLREADEKFHAPTIGLLIGRSLVALGRVAEAADQLDRIAEEDVPSDAPEAWRNAVKLAASDRSSLDAKLGKLVLEVTPERAEAQVKLGARAARPARGTHVVDADDTVDVRVEARGYRVAVRSVMIAAGEESTVSIALEPLAPDAPPPPPDEAPPPAKSLLATPWPTVVAGGATLITFAIGAGLGASALSDAGDLEDRCGDAKCSKAPARERAELRDLQESGGSTADASTAFFVVSGVAAAATGVFAVLWRTSASASAEQPAQPSAQFVGGPGWAKLSGSF